MIHHLPTYGEDMWVIFCFIFLVGSLTPQLQDAGARSYAHTDCNHHNTNRPAIMHAGGAVWGAQRDLQRLADSALMGESKADNFLEQNVPYIRNLL